MVVKRGRLWLITGPMFSGKTSRLRTELHKFSIAGYDPICFKPLKDTRAKNAIKTHMGDDYKAIPVYEEYDIYTASQDKNIIGIDEFQFFEDSIIEVIRKILDDEKVVICCGLCWDSEGRQFGVALDLIRRIVPERIITLRSVCNNCGEFDIGSYTVSLTSKDGEQVKVGGSEQYATLCHLCYWKEPGGLNENNKFDI